MAILPMHYIPDPVLREKAKKVRKLDDPALRKLAEDLIESMDYYEGVGLAANQVGSLRRICTQRTSVSAGSTSSGVHEALPSSMEW